ncbi:Uncharacterised protein [Salmonella enterica subsp. enterica serovar Bovismorbificans]|uniref:Uncharacterized protein n=1 Tax=Salmonella enterica subsp. enterica serovar Bovismorbificans TaxID=58097 RepID=A0A655EKV7_SALET|nr:Uncharacterised protein [Salmonella enterica subsp. enterica serovar Bovismorbificans]
MSRNIAQWLNNRAAKMDNAALYRLLPYRRMDKKSADTQAYGRDIFLDYGHVNSSMISHPRGFGVTF